VIEAVLPRTSLVYRSDGRREKPIAANVTQAIVVVATTPRPSADFIDRCLAALEHAGVNPVLAQNKIDLDTQGTLRSELLARYQALGYPLCELCAHTSCEPLRPTLAAQASVLVGQSGVGKSTIVNALLPRASARTAGVSRAETGRHTTTHTRLYRLDADSTLIDSPGMQQFGVQHIAPAELAACFVEFRPFLGECRFNDCRHTDEPGCALAEALRRGHISAQRMEGYRRILRALSAAPSNARRTEPGRNREQEDDEQP
jgi:ribosome biogenesis GTPase